MQAGEPALAAACMLVVGPEACLQQDMVEVAPQVEEAEAAVLKRSWNAEESSNAAAWLRRSSIVGAAPPKSWIARRNCMHPAAAAVGSQSWPAGNHGALADSMLLAVEPQRKFKRMQQASDGKERMCTAM